MSRSPEFDYYAPFKGWLCYVLMYKPDKNGKRPSRNSWSEKDQTNLGTFRTQGGFSKVGKQLGIGASKVKEMYYAAEKRSNTSRGERELIAWLDYRERMWWCYQHTEVEKNDISYLEFIDEVHGDRRVFTRGTTTIGRKEGQKLTEEAKALLETTWGVQSYIEWLGHHNLRSIEQKCLQFGWKLVDGIPLGSPVSDETKRRKEQTRHANQAPRDHAIRELRRVGVSPKRLAERFEMTTARISQICQPAPARRPEGVKREPMFLEAHMDETDSLLEFSKKAKAQYYEERIPGHAIYTKAELKSHMSDWISKNYPGHTGISGCSCPFCDPVLSKRS